jgi:hypothetical protein
MINDNLLNGVATTIGVGSGYSIPSHLAFGSTTGTLTAADVITSGEFDRNALSGVVVNNNSITFTGARLSTEANNEYVNVISMTNSGTLRGSNDIQVSFLVPSLLHSTSFDINVDIYLTVNRG